MSPENFITKNEFENNIKNKDNNDKNADISEEEKIEEFRKQLDFKATKEKISIEIETEDKIFHLKELIEYWFISKETVKKVISWEEITNNEIKDIFEKIEELENNENIWKYLPIKLLITKKQYTRSLNDEIYRKNSILKLNKSLSILSKQFSTNSYLWVDVFSWFLYILDKNLITIQEHTIDIKDSLEAIDKKVIKKYDKKLSLFERIIKFLKKLFTN